MKPTDSAILIVRRVPYFTGEIKTKQKLHFSIGHQTMIGQVSFFSCPDSLLDVQSLHFNKNSLKSVDTVIEFATKVEYAHEDFLPKPPKAQAKPDEETKDASATAV